MPLKLSSLLSSIFSGRKTLNTEIESRPLTPLPSTKLINKTEPSIGAYDIGFAVGAAGGDINRAAQIQYILSRVLSTGEKPTNDLIGKIVGMLGGGMPEAVIIDTILRGQ